MDDEKSLVGPVEHTNGEFPNPARGRPGYPHLNLSPPKAAVSARGSALAKGVWKFSVCVLLPSFKGLRSALAMGS